VATSGLYRWAGYAGVVGAILLVLGDWIHPQSLVAANRTTWELAHELIFCSIVLAIPTIFALYTRQAGETGGLGFLGFSLVFIGLMGFSGIVWFEAFVSPALVGDSAVAAALEKLETGETAGLLLPVLMLSSVLFSLGWLLFGWATARAGVLPRPAAYVALVGGVFFGLGPLLFSGVPILDKMAATIFGVGFAWLAFGLTIERRMLMASAPS
jgi:hypothetical protein